MKCQSASHTLAVIPAVHQSGKERTCSIQLITECDAWNAIFLPEMFRKQRKNLWIGDNQFGQNGFRLKIRMPGLTADGKLDFGAISPLRYDIMGPFALMLSVADIPMAGIHFNGVIAVILWKGKEYRLATYLGAKVVQIQNGKIRIVQGDMELEARLLEKVKCSLKAPVAGNMNRTNCILL